MTEEKIIVLGYKEILKKIEGQEAHLLLGNGFNRGLGIDTSYKGIFNRMLNNDKGIYKDALNIVEDSEYDLELFIGKLCDDININNPFLKKYVANKVKLDFMKAAHDIVKDKIKNVYAEKMSEYICY